MLRRTQTQVWDQLRGKKPQLQKYVEEIVVENLRGIRHLAVRFPYPVVVLAGPNASGKSTVLNALACAYDAPDRGPRDLVPSSLFPDFRTKEAGVPSDSAGAPTRLTFHYIDGIQRSQMVWTRGRKWNRSFGGRKKGTQPQGIVYRRTLANLSNPSEVRSVLQLGRQPLTTREVTSDLLILAHRILPFHYGRLTVISARERSLLFAVRDDAQGATYSEFHMSAGERAVLRISQDLAARRQALVLIDEVEAGLHPFTQQQLMLELQRLALRNDLQIVVATHSPVILDCVPPEGRVFLERSGDNVAVAPSLRDVMQRAFYGQSMDRLSILCEDEMAEAVVRGVVDHLAPRMDLSPSVIEVGRDTGKDQFPQHVRALAKFQSLDDFLLVLDGDAGAIVPRIEEAAREFQQSVRPLLLPGGSSPEAWIWGRLTARPDRYGPPLGTTAAELGRLLAQGEGVFAGAADSPSNIAKNRLEALAEQLSREAVSIGRLVGRLEAGEDHGDMATFRTELEESIAKWRALGR